MIRASFSNTLRLLGWLMLAFVLVSTAAPGSASAQTADSKTLFAEGRRLREDGKCAEAIDAFRRALEAWPQGIGSLRNIAECEAEIGRYASARRSYWDLRRQALLSEESKYDGWEKDAEEAHAALDALTPRLTVILRGAAPDEVRVLINGEVIVPNLVNVALERDVGKHLVEVWHDKKRLASKEVLLDASQKEEITLSVVLPATKSKPVPIVPPDRPTSPLLIGGIVGFAVGGLSIGGMIAAAVIRGGAVTDLEAGCPMAASGDAVTCGPNVEAAVKRGEGATLAFNVLTGIAAVGIAAGVTLVVISETTEEGEAALMVSPTVGGAAVSARWRF